MIKSTEIPLILGEKYTIYGLSGIATTSCREIIVTNVLENPEYKKSYMSDKPNPYGNWRFGAYRQFRKRKQYHLDIELAKTLIIPGWNLMKTDADAYHCFVGNACINLAGTVDEIKEFVKLNINKRFGCHDIILSVPKPHLELPDEDGIPVYPDHPTTHAVVQRIRENIKNRDTNENTI